MIDPHKHPRRYAAFVEQQMASRGRALGQAMTLRQAARRLGITPLRAEQLAARHGFTFHQGKESNQ